MNVSKNKSKIILVSLIVLTALGAAVFFLKPLINKSSPQSFADYKQPALRSDWKANSMVFDGKRFSFACPSDWQIIDRYNEPSDAFSEVQLVSPDYEAIDNTDDFAIKGTVKKGAAVTVRVEKYNGNLESYANELKSGKVGLLTASGYRDLEYFKVGDRTVLGYITVANFKREAVVVDGSYLARVTYAQPYVTSSQKEKPKLNDTHMETFKAIIASIGY